MSRAEPTRTVVQRYEMDKRYKTRKGEGKHEDRLTHLERKRKAQTRSQASDTDPRPKVSIEATSVHGAYLTQDQRGQDAGQVAQELGYIYSSEQKERPDAEYNNVGGLVTRERAGCVEAWTRGLQTWARRARSKSRGVRRGTGQGASAHEAIHRS